MNDYCHGCKDFVKMEVVERRKNPKKQHHKNNCEVFFLNLEKFEVAQRTDDTMLRVLYYRITSTVLVECTVQLFSLHIVDPRRISTKYFLIQSTRLKGYDLIVTFSVMVTTFRRKPDISPNPNRYGKGMLWVYALYVPLYDIQLPRPIILTCARSSSLKFIG